MDMNTVIFGRGRLSVKGDLGIDPLIDGDGERVRRGGHCCHDSGLPPGAFPLNVLKGQTC